jgi:hypothetical protein
MFGDRSLRVTFLFGRVAGDCPVVVRGFGPCAGFTGLTLIHF